MTDVLKEARKLFNSESRQHKDVIPEYVCEFDICKSQMPSVEQLSAFLTLTSNRDRMELSFRSNDEITFVVQNGGWDEKYTAFVSNLYEDNDVVNVKIIINKKFVDGVLSVYCFSDFEKYLYGLNYAELLSLFSDLFKKYGNNGLNFEIFDEHISLITNSITFSNDVLQYHRDNSQRSQLLHRCDEASIFLNRQSFRVIPEDFEIIFLDDDDRLEKLAELFEKLRSILSYLYVANTSSIEKGNAIIQFDPSSVTYNYSLKDLSNNQVIKKVYSWVFSNEKCVDKATIARKIINIHCHDSQEVLSIDEKVLNSIKSDYVIYQKNHAEQYIQMKSKIADYIVDSTDKIQTISHDYLEGLRNNFIGVIIFLITVLLTDSIDFRNFISTKAPINVVRVCWLFTAGTILYFLATIVMEYWKWRWLDQSYITLKNSYSDTFEKEDLEQAFHYDAPIKTAKQQFIKVSTAIGVLWGLFIVVMVWFTCTISK